MQTGIKSAKAFSRSLINNFQNSLPRFETEIENIVQQNLNNLNHHVSDEEYAARVSSSFNDLAETGSQSFEGEEKKLARGITIRIFKDFLSSPRMLANSEPSEEVGGMRMEEEKKEMNDQEEARLKDSIAVSFNRGHNESTEIEQEDDSCIPMCALADNFKRLWGKVQAILTKKHLGIGLLLGGSILLGAQIGVRTGITATVTAGAVGGGLIGLAVSIVISLASHFFMDKKNDTS